MEQVFLASFGLLTENVHVLHLNRDIHVQFNQVNCLIHFNYFVKYQGMNVHCIKSPQCSLCLLGSTLSGSPSCGMLMCKTWKWLEWETPYSSLGLTIFDSQRTVSQLQVFSIISASQKTTLFCIQLSTCPACVCSHLLIDMILKRNSGGYANVCYSRKNVTVVLVVGACQALIVSNEGN